MPTSKGKITWIGETTVVSDKFTKREFAVEVTQTVPDTGEEWRHEEAFQLGNANTALLDNISVGASVQVTFGIRSNKVENDGGVRYFTNLNAFKVEVQGAAAAAPANAGTGTVDNGDDLPF